MARIWITGARGFIGRQLAIYCAGLNHTVSGVGHGTWSPVEAARHGLDQWINGDVTGSNLQALCGRDGPPAAIIHLAGGSSVGAAIAQPSEDFSRTVGSSVALLEWIRQESPATRLVAVSSAAVYGAGHEGKISEAAALTPHSPYGFHKMMMENLCQSYASSYGISVAIARLFSVYGDGLRKQLLWDLCCKLAGPGKVIELGGDGEELRDWLGVADAVKNLEGLSGIASPDVPVLNVGTGKGTSVREVATLVMDAWRGDREPDRTLKFTGLARPGDPRSLVADSGVLAARGMVCRTTIGQGAVEYVRWFRTTNQPLP